VCLHVQTSGQEPVLYAGSIRDNIVVGKPGATDTEIIAAAKAANAHDFISSFGADYATNCGQGGAQLSGGQKQVTHTCSDSANCRSTNEPTSTSSSCISE
jgi:ABC-type multidrug transport system fused ATPase/permease subunit